MDHKPISNIPNFSFLNQEFKIRDKQLASEINLDLIMGISECCHNLGCFGIIGTSYTNNNLKNFIGR